MIKVVGYLSYIIARSLVISISFVHLSVCGEVLPADGSREHRQTHSAGDTRLLWEAYLVRLIAPATPI